MPNRKRLPGRIGWALVAIGSAALTLRLVGLQYGLPAVYNPDEAAIMNRALGFATGDPSPHNFLYPTFYFYALFAWEGAAFVAGWIARVYPSLAAFRHAFFVDPTPLYTTGRALTAVCGAATVWAVYRLGARLFDRTAGLTSAVVLAVAPIAVRDAHYVKHDVPVTLLIVLTYAALAGVLVNPRQRERRMAWLGVGALVGLACSTHYYAVFLAVPVALVALLGDTSAPARVRWSRLGAAAAAAAIAFVVTSPFVLIEWRTAWHDIVANRQIVVDRAVGTGAFASLGRYLFLLAADGLGWPIAVAAGVGLVLAIRHGGGRGWLLLAFPVPFLLFISNTVPASRYLNPVLPFAAVAAGVAVSQAASWAGSRRAVVVATAVTLLVSAPAAVAAAHGDWFFRQADTRTLALDYIESRIPAGSTVAVQPYSVPLRQSREGLVEALRAHLGSETRASIRFQLELSLAPYPEPSYRTIYLGTGGLDVDKIYVPPSALGGAARLVPLRDLAVTYVILKKYNGGDPSLQSLQAALDQEGRLVATFSPYREEVSPARRAIVGPFLHNTDARIADELARPGPTIEIWRID